MFPQRATVSDILDGYVGRRVYNESDLIHALSDDQVKRIVLAAPMMISRPLHLRQTGRVIVGTRATPITVVRPMSSLFTVLSGCEVVGVWAVPSTHIEPGEAGAFVTDGGEFTEYVAVRDCLASDRFAKAVRVTGSASDWHVANLIVYAQDAPGIDFDYADTCLIEGGRASGIRIAGGSENRVVNARVGGTGIDTASSGGSNVIMGNVAASPINAHTTDQVGMNIL